MTHDFEDVEIKINAPLLLEEALKKKRKKCMIGTGAMSDPYMPVPENLSLTRRCLEIIERHGFGVSLQTKSNLILHDLDVLKKINANLKCVVAVTLTTYDEDLCKILEPNVCTTKDRFEALKILRDNGIKTIVWLSPILPFINDTKENINGILQYCVEAKVYGILCFNMGLTLREGDREYYYKKLDQHFPGLQQKYQNKYGYNYELLSDNNRELMGIFTETCRQNNIRCVTDEVFSYMRSVDETKTSRQPQQRDLFEDV
jgi:DNA repair photolyase